MSISLIEIIIAISYAKSALHHRIGRVYSGEGLGVGAEILGSAEETQSGLFDGAGGKSFECAGARS